MEKLSRLFGRKPRLDSKAQEKDVVQESDPTQADTVQQPSISPEQAYGLVFVFPSGESKTFTSLPISMGRSEENSLIINDETVSASHAQVYYDDLAKDVCILDKESVNGVWIDGQPTRKNVLHDGVRIKLGSVELTFRDTGYIHASSSE